MQQRPNPVNEENAPHAEDRRSVNQSQSRAKPILINSRQYELGDLLGEGGYGQVYEGRRVEDDLKVAVKIVEKHQDLDMRYTTIPDHPKAIPMEIALHILANKEPRAPEIIQLLDWDDQRDRYIMVMEDFSPCIDMFDHVKKNRKVDEDLAKVVMRSAITAARECFERGVFHRDIKLDNLLINTDTQEVKLIDFGCGDLLKNSTYTNFIGTNFYICPEYFTEGEYYADQATVYSLGVTLFTMVCAKYPRFKDRNLISRKAFQKDDLSEECCDLIQACLQNNPEQRIHLDQIFAHRWFEDTDIKMPETPECSDSVDVIQSEGQNTIKTIGRVMLWAADKAASLYNFYNAMCIM